MPTWVAVLIGLTCGGLLVAVSVYWAMRPERLGRKSKLPDPTGERDIFHSTTNIWGSGNE